MTKTSRYCASCGKILNARMQKFCNDTCEGDYKHLGPIAEREKYDPQAHLEDLLKEGFWLLFSASTPDRQCSGRFEERFHRVPEYVIWVPGSPLSKYAGPVHDDEREQA